MISNIKRHTSIQAILLSLAIIVTGVFIATYNNKVIPLSGGSLSHYQAEPSHPLNLLGNWDTSHYMSIATSGYEKATDPAFFPLYPLLISIVSKVVGSPLTAGLLISWVSLIGAVYYYIKIINVWWRPKNGEHIQAALLFVFFPTAMFMLGAYTEALFVFLSLGAIYHAATNRFILSSLFLIGATGTRVTGVFTLALVLLIMIEKRQKLFSLFKTAAIGISGLAAYCIYLYLQYGNFFEFLVAQRYWNRFQGDYVATLAHSVNLLNIGFVALILGTITYWLLKKRMSFAIYTALFLIIPFGTGSFETFNRYVLVAFPVMWMLYDITQSRPTLRMAILCGSVILWTYYLLQFAGGYNGG
jgi:Gpi18-like mannosyltransferase